MATLPASVDSDGPIDHIAFTGNDLTRMRDHLAAQGILFDEEPIASRPLHQIFVRDPVGLKVEMKFSTQQPAVNK